MGAAARGRGGDAAGAVGASAAARWCGGGGASRWQRYRRAVGGEPRAGGVVRGGPVGAHPLGGRGGATAGFGDGGRLSGGGDQSVGRGGAGVVRACRSPPAARTDRRPARDEPGGAGGA